METPPPSSKVPLSPSTNNPQNSKVKSRVAVAKPIIARVLSEDFKLIMAEELLKDRTVETPDTSSISSPEPVPVQISDSPESPDLVLEAEENRNPVEAEVNLEAESIALIDEFNAGKYKVGVWTRFFTWLKELFCPGYDSKNRNTDLATEAFGKIKNKPAFLKEAFEYIALPENTNSLEENTEDLLKFCQSADPKLIVDGFCTISDPTGKLGVFDVLVKANNFDLKKLDGEQSLKLAQAMLVADGENKLAELVINNQLSVDNFSELSPEQSLKLAQAMLVAGGENKLVELLMQVENFPALGEEQVKALATALLAVDGNKGAIPLARFVIAGKLGKADLSGLNGEQSLKLAQAMLAADGEKKLAELVINDQLSVENFSGLSPEQVKALVDALLAVDGNKGAIPLAQLLETKKVQVDGEQALKLAQTLAVKGEDGIQRLMALAENKLLPELTFAGTDSGKFARFLAGKGVDGIKCLTALDQNNLLPKPLQFDGTGSGKFAQFLAGKGADGIKCLTALVERDLLPKSLEFEGTDSGKFALALVRKDTDGIRCLTAL
ncbi:MAG: hypothetical protein LBF49_02750, partial [Puniceicoccales bacterium]|nr:hypothetical protein [Puniceicoccales bacterium]